MIRALAAAAVVTLALACPAAAQTYGQPVYLNAWGRPIGGSPLSEVETRSHVGTGRWADGYSDRPQIYVPGPGYARNAGYGQGYGDRQSYGHAGHGYRHDRSDRRYDPPSQPGYRDEWGYNDDRPPSARRGSYDPRGHRHDRDCGCSDVYFYDR